jgi:regulator of sigma E protease
MCYWLLAIPILALLILAHEWGHFISACWMQVRVLQFGVGLGPRALKLGERNGVLYTLHWLPIGGFVLPAGENDETVPDGLAAKRPWRRAIVLAAGAVMNLFLAFLIFTALALVPHDVPLTGQVGVVGIMPDTPAERAGLRGRDILLRVNGRPVVDQQVLLELTLNGGREVELVVLRNDHVLTLTVIPTIEPIHEVDHLGVSRYLMQDPVATLSQVLPDRPAYAAGLRSGDVIVSLNGHVVQDKLDFWETLIVERDAGGPLVFVVQREGQVLPPITVIPPPPDAEDQTIGIGSLPAATRERLSVPAALLQGARDTIDAVLLVPRVLAAVARGSIPVQDLAGPVGIVQATQQVGEGSSLAGIARFAGMLSANLFVVNLLPLPALDGGRLAFVLLEMIRRRRIPSHVELRIHKWGMYGLLAFLALVTVFDLVRLFAG